MPLRPIMLGDSPETTLIAAAFWGYGGLLTLITLGGAGSYRHYLEIIAPVMALWTAMLAFWADEGARRPRARPALAILCAAQAAMSLLLLAYIDRVGAIPGDFGVSWRAQQAGMKPISAAAPPPRTAAGDHPVRGSIRAGG